MGTISLTHPAKNDIKQERAGQMLQWEEELNPPKITEMMRESTHWPRLKKKRRKKKR